MPQRIKVVKRSGLKPSIVNSGEIKATSQIKKPEITKLKRLRVSILRGRLIALRIGLTKEFTIPRRMPAKSKVLKICSHSKRVGKIGPVKVTPDGINFTANKRVKKPMTICQNNRESIYFYTIIIITTSQFSRFSIEITFLFCVACGDRLGRNGELH